LRHPRDLLYLENSVEHPCYKCGAAVEDGTAFCPHCAAPQIRVSGPASVQAADSPEAETHRAPFGATTLVRPKIEWPPALKSIAIALLVAILMVAFGMPPLLGMLVAGFLTVLLYHRRSVASGFTTGFGARLGLLTGALGFTMFGILVALAVALGSGPQIHDELLKRVQQYAARSSDPNLGQVMDLLKTPEGFAIVVALSLVMTLVAFLLFSSLGGAIGALLLRRRARE